MMFGKTLAAFKGDDRSIRYKKNIVLLIVFQVAGIMINLLLIPITLQYLGVQEYGVWITLTTIISWFVFFDIGLGHGLRNKYAEAKAKNNETEIKYYVSTTFFSLGIISSILFVVFLIFSIFIDWSIVLNAPPALAPDLKTLAVILAATFCLRFIVTIVCSLLTADQKPAIPAFINFTGHLLSFIIVLLITRVTSSSLLYIGIALSVSQLLPLVIAFFYFFLTRYRPIVPSPGYFSRKHVRLVFSLGIRFFLIQITSLVLYQSNNIIMAHTCGLTEVTKFSIAYKYLNVLYMFFGIFLTPFWSASTEAFVKDDISWIKKSIKKLNYLWMSVIAGGVIMVALASLVYKVWLNDRLVPDFYLLGLLLIYFICLAKSTMYRSFMNGVGKISLQFYVTILQCFLHVPLAITLSRYIGLYGIVITMILWVFINAVWERVQFVKIINKTAQGIWNK